MTKKKNKVKSFAKKSEKNLSPASPVFMRVGTGPAAPPPASPLYDWPDGRLGFKS